MRIIAGEWRGRPLEAPPGQATRPTSDRAREGLFSMLASRIGSFEGLQVADLFAGTGALGLEALSRGAAHCTFVEKDRAALDVLGANIARLGAAARATSAPRPSSTRRRRPGPATSSSSTRPTAPASPRPRSSAPPHGSRRAAGSASSFRTRSWRFPPASKRRPNAASARRL